ncbi:hypothetical protein GCM10023320_61190 [Pseudonocardia adelaidensis]|uniref:Uncharacterized protein n=1 Tax=Pseudonocardia adelaidensis TaxID=648754 RepID=A0ABP9P085_9PSEU
MLAEAQRRGWTLTQAEVRARVGAATASSSAEAASFRANRGLLGDVAVGVPPTGAVVPSVDQARPLAPGAPAAALGPVGGSASRLLDAWHEAVVAAGG